MGKMCDFLFGGAGVLPLVMFLAGEPVVAMGASLFLCLAGALFGIADPEAPHHNVRR